MAFCPVQVAATSIHSAYISAPRTIGLQGVMPPGPVLCLGPQRVGADQNLPANVSKRRDLFQN